MSTTKEQQEGKRLRVYCQVCLALPNQSLTSESHGSFVKHRPKSGARLENVPRLHLLRSKVGAAASASLQYLINK